MNICIFCAGVHEKNNFEIFYLHCFIIISLSECVFSFILQLRILFCKDIIPILVTFRLVVLNNMSKSKEGHCVLYIRIWRIEDADVSKNIKRSIVFLGKKISKQFSIFYVKL